VAEGTALLPMHARDAYCPAGPRRSAVCEGWRAVTASEESLGAALCAKWDSCGGKVNAVEALAAIRQGRVGLRDLSPVQWRAPALGLNAAKSEPSL
jgi:hypothetical protein